MRPLLGALLALLATGLDQVRAQEPAVPSPAADPVVELANAELAGMRRYAGTSRDPQQMLQRNLSRYFVLSMMPANHEEIGRVLGTAERMSRRFAGRVYRDAEALARQQGSASIESSQIRSILSSVLPVRATPYREFLYFPEAPHPLKVEAIDLQAFFDTGFAWSVLIHLAESEIQPDPSALPLPSDATRALAVGVNQYGLLLLRIGGLQARLDFAPYLQSRHLRAAGKTIDQRGADLEPLPSRFDVARNSEPWFADVTEASGIEFRHVSSDWIARFRRYGFTAPSFSGGGVSAGHLNDDNAIDLMICGGRGCSVFFNRGNGRFEDVTESTGLAFDGEARMALLADFDNDGRTDVFLTYARDTNRIYRNLGSGRFADVTESSGLARDGLISGPAVAVDIDNDGWLDIYVGNFGNYLARESPFSPNSSTNGMPNRLYRSQGGFRFEDVTERAGVGNTGWTQALSHLDYDLDGDQDLYIANDFGPNDLLVNQGDGTFSSAGITTGSDDPFHGMNVSFADLNRDRLADIFITNIWFWNPTRDVLSESNSLLLSDVNEAGEILFRRSESPELLQHDTGWSWGSVFLDADNDGDDDLYVANGFTDYMTFAQYRRSPTYPDELYAINNGREPNWFFRNDTGLPTSHVPGSGAELDQVNSRGVSVLDFDRDGDLDLAVSTFHAPFHLFRNDGASAENRWLSVDLVGDPSQGVSRDAVGTVVMATRGDFYAWRMRTGGEGYLSMGSPELEFGLGPHESVDLEVIWPGGTRQRFPDIPANRHVRLVQGDPKPQVQP